jgi:acetolactate synthase-1/2/3 large subunit
MSGFEIETAVRLGVSVIVVVLCDGMYHRVWVKQRHLGLPSVAVEFNKPRVAEIARAQGASGYYVRDLEDLAGVCEYAFDRRGVTVVEVPVDPGSYDEVYNRGFKLVDLISRGRRALGGGVQKG